MIIKFSNPASSDQPLLTNVNQRNSIIMVPAHPSCTMQDKMLTLCGLNVELLGLAGIARCTPVDQPQIWLYLDHLALFILQMLPLEYCHFPVKKNDNKKIVQKFFFFKLSSITGRANQSARKM